MIETVIQEYESGNLCAAGYSIRRKIDRALTQSGQRVEVINAREEILNHGGDLDYFTSEMLVHLWASDHVTAATKVMATLWWGNVSRFIYDTLFSNKGITQIANNSPRIISALAGLSAEEDFDAFKQGLSVLFQKLSTKDENYAIKGIGPSFFTKFFHFWFTTHPLASNPSFLPIICDGFLRKTVYANMVEEGDFTRATIFKKDNNNDIWLKGNQFNSYWMFISYFNNKANELGFTPFKLEQLCFTDYAKHKANRIVELELKYVFLQP